MASLWKHPQSRFWTACFRDAGGRQRRISTRESNPRKAQKIAEAYEKASREKKTRLHTRLFMQQSLVGAFHGLAVADFLPSRPRRPLLLATDVQQDGMFPVSLQQLVNIFGPS
jgi:hypothetical protein